MSGVGEPVGVCRGPSSVCWLVLGIILSVGGELGCCPVELGLDEDVMGSDWIDGVAGVHARKKRRLRRVSRPEPSTLTLY